MVKDGQTRSLIGSYKPYHPTFGSGHCFMVETLNKPEVEAIGPLVFEEIKRLEAEGEYAGHIRKAIRKMDYPEPERIA